MPNQGRRSAPLPKGWHRIRRRILKRDGWMCQREIATGGKCAEPANEVDHIVPASHDGGDGDDNLESLCTWHHAQKTGREASAVAHAKPPRARPQEKHPGFIN
ncbi:HNH endonuclease [Streptomyces sp. NPDC127074]|uniref:HNH endonuclease n=1 Tax=Streptomyces sp. NPDC127074 TaxID=3347130 RepID=UPI00366A10D0